MILRYRQNLKKSYQQLFVSIDKRKLALLNDECDQFLWYAVVAIINLSGGNQCGISFFSYFVTGSGDFD